VRTKQIIFCVWLGFIILPLSLPEMGTLQAEESVAVPYLKTELYFGPIDHDDWNDFLAKTVTPRFPQGLTWFDVHGQWRDSSGTVRELNSRLLILIYPRTIAADRSIEKIRSAFKTQFHQQSVLRVTEKVEASF
jgi:hypothetical protein